MFFGLEKKKFINRKIICVFQESSLHSPVKFDQLSIFFLTQTLNNVCSKHAHRRFFLKSMALPSTKGSSSSCLCSWSDWSNCCLYQIFTRYSLICTFKASQWFHLYDRFRVMCLKIIGKHLLSVGNDKYTFLRHSICVLRSLNKRF